MDRTPLLQPKLSVDAYEKVKPVTCVSSLDRESPLVLYWLLVGQRRRALKQ